MKDKIIKDREQIDDLQSNQLEFAHILEDMQHKMFKIQVLKLHKCNAMQPQIRTKVSIRM